MRTVVHRAAVSFCSWERWWEHRADFGASPIATGTGIPGSTEGRQSASSRFRSCSWNASHESSLRREHRLRTKTQAIGSPPSAIRLRRQSRFHGVELPVVAIACSASPTTNVPTPNQAWSFCTRIARNRPSLPPPQPVPLRNQRSRLLGVMSANPTAAHPGLGVHRADDRGHAPSDASPRHRERSEPAFAMSRHDL
jgi:hypothetical protein